jgi:FkbM family methyltransferase
VELAYNLDAAFTQWVVKQGYLQEPFVLVDVGVQHGEHPRWHQLGDYLVVHGFDAIAEAVDELTQRNAGKRNRHYHWIAAGTVDEERAFYFNPANPTASSMYPHGESRFDTIAGQEVRKVQVRRLDTLLAEGMLPRADFLKLDVEGFEHDVLRGAGKLLEAGVLGVEAESNFGISPTYPKGHFATVHEVLLHCRLLVFDIGFNRIPRASFQRALVRRGHKAVTDEDSLGKPAKVDVLFCRDPIDEADHPENYQTTYQSLNLEQLIKLMIMYELHGLNDIAVDTVERFADRLKGRLDTEQAIRLLADPHCRPDPLRRFVRNTRRSVRRRMRSLKGAIESA